MIGALFNGISGLDSFQKALNTQSNNIANINTVAYKTDGISFVDLMYQDRIGKGTATVTVEKNFTQGDFKITENSYDMAIDGPGYFTIYDPEQDEYYVSKAGDFKQDVDGFLVTASGKYVMGIPATITGDMIINEDYPRFIASQVVSTTGNVESINIKASDYVSSATDEVDAGTGIITKPGSSISANIEALKVDYQEKLASYAINPTNAGTASTTQQSDVVFADYATAFQSGTYVSIHVDNVKYTQYYNESETAEIAMQRLAAQIAKAEGVKDATFDPATGTLSIEGLVPGESFNVFDADIDGTAYNTINTTAAVLGSGEAAMNSSFAALQDAITRANAELRIVNTDITIPPKGTVDTTITMDIEGFNNLQLNLTELGISDSQFSDFEVDNNGILYMVQGDNKYAVGQVPTVAFKNEHGLLPDGDKLYRVTQDAGEPINAAYGTKIYGKTLELSNSNMGESLVELMTFQRAYEANSRSITTADEFLNIAIQLKK